MKSFEILPPRKDPIPNQFFNMLGTKTNQTLPPKLAAFCPRYESIINEAEYCHSYSTYTSPADKELYVYNLKSINNNNVYKKYKDENLQHRNSNESVIKKTKEEEEE